MTIVPIVNMEPITALMILPKLCVTKVVTKEALASNPRPTFVILVLLLFMLPSFFSFISKEVFTI